MSVKHLDELNIIQISRLIISIYKNLYDEYESLCLNYGISTKNLFTILYKDSLYRKINIQEKTQMFDKVYGKYGQIYYNALLLIKGEISTSEFVQLIHDTELGHDAITIETCKNIEDILSNSLQYCINEGEIEKMEKICYLLDLCELCKQGV